MIRSFMYSFCVSCIFRIVRVKRSFRLRLVRIVNLYDPGSVCVFRVSFFFIGFWNCTDNVVFSFSFVCKTKSDNKSCHSSQSDFLFCFY